MTQPKRPISRSSTPIEFTPLILDLEPEVKEEPKKKRGGSFLLMTVVGIAIALGALSYLALKKSGIDGQTTIVSPNTKTTGIFSTASVSPDEKRRIFSHGISNAKLILENVDGQDILKVLFKTKQARALHGYMNGQKITSHSAKEIVPKISSGATMWPSRLCLLMERSTATLRF